MDSSYINSPRIFIGFSTLCKLQGKADDGGKGSVHLHRGEVQRGNFGHLCFKAGDTGDC